MSSWLMAIRPKTLTASISPVLLTFSFIYYQTKQIPSLIIFITTALCALFMQVGTNLVNDYFDGIDGLDDNEKRLGPTRVVAAGIIPARRVQFGYQICFFIAFLLGLTLMYTGGITIFIIGILSLLSAYAYTGGPFPLSRFGLGEIFAFIFFGPVACIGTGILLSSPNLLEVFFMSLPMGLWSAALMSVNNLRDLENDKTSNKVTISTLLGLPNARYMTLLLLFSPLLFMVLVIIKLKMPIYFLITLLAIVPLIKEINKILKSPLSKEFNMTLAQTGKSLTIFTLVNTILFFVL